MANVSYVIEKQIAVLSTSKKGWTKEVNLISWNNAPAKLDIRDWDPDHVKMGKGITLSPVEAADLVSALKHWLEPQAVPPVDPIEIEEEPEEPEAKPNQDGFTPEQQAMIEKAKAAMQG